MKETIRIDGKYWTKWAYSSTKRKAIKYRNREKKKGRYVRLLKRKNGYHLYIRKRR